MNKKTNHNKNIDVVTIGGVDLDLVLTVPRFPGHDEKEHGQLVGRLPGGPAANFACAAARLGLNVASLCQVGDDEAGNKIIEDFSQYNVDTSFIEIIKGAETPYTIILIDPSGEKSIIIVPTFQPNYSLERSALLLARTNFIYTIPENETNFMALADLAHKQAAQVMIDVEPSSCTDRSKLERLLSQTDIAGFNQFGFRTAVGSQPSIEAARTLLPYGPHTILVTLGAAGALAVTEKEALHQPGFQVPVVDTTGAGDTFNAAFLAATIEGREPAERLHFATAAAALSVTSIGPRGLLPTRTEIEEFLSTSGNLL